MKQIRILALLLLTGLSRSFAAEIPAWHLIPFTGMDYIRIVVDAGFQQNISNTFTVTIRSTADNSVLWEGPVQPQPAVNEGKKQIAFTIRNLKPILWSPSNPYLYDVSLQQFSGKKLQHQLKERAGFRSFERRAGNLYLNGKPIFLRGIAINPPGRGIPEELENSRAFALDYVKYMKSINVNIIRIPDAEAWFDVCDELGMMVFGGNYSGKVGKGEKVQASEPVGDETDGGFPKDYNQGVSWYENEKLGLIAHHPSLMVYAMTNETPFVGKRAELWEKFLSYAFNKLKAWDETRVYIANAGYGYGKAGDICDIHRYWGWYYNSPYTFLNIRNNAAIIPFPKKGQPITFTECVGNYTGPDGRYNLTPWHKNPSSQLAWTGHERQDLQAQLADEHQIATLREATESFRQFRAINPDLSGVFPFTILFYNWDTIKKFADMKPKPVTEQVKLSYQPILLSWECWTPNVYAGTGIKPIVHIINDDDDFRDLKGIHLEYELLDKTKSVLLQGNVNLPNIPYYSTYDQALEITLPKHINSGHYELRGKIISGADVVSTNYYRLFIADSSFSSSASTATGPLLVYDSLGLTKEALNQLHIPYTAISNFKKLSPHSILLIGENAANKQMTGQAAEIKKYVQAGGRILSLRQDSLHLSWLNALLANPLGNTNTNIDNPVYPVTTKSPRTGYSVNPERPDHPIFNGITRENLRVWSDYTDWNATRTGWPAIQPVTDGFTLAHNDDVAHTAILANYSSGLRGIALAEQFSGKGSHLVCGFDLVRRVTIDPIATRLLLNLIGYTGSATDHQPYPFITSPISWGEYETEKGVVTDIYSGFLVNATPRLPASFTKGISVTKEGYQLAGGNRSGFNSRPGIQYVANGRRPFGPFIQSFGGQPQISDKNSVEGIGKFWCNIPEGQNRATSIIWNPSEESLTIKIKINDLPETDHTIPAGERVTVAVPVDRSAVNMTFTGDRRLVILETAFSKKN